jgi:hypothetical protein
MRDKGASQMVDAPTQIRIVKCRGTAREIGAAHGESTRDLIALGLGNWQANLTATRGEVDAYIADFLARSSFGNAIARHAAHLGEEVRGIAEGANQPYETILAYNLMDEEWSFRSGQLDGIAPGCTALAIDGKYIGQTMDIPTVHDGTQIVLAIEPATGPAARVFTAAGMLGLNGANSAGVGLVVNNLTQLPSAATGLPVAFVTRSILGHDTAEAAARWVESVPHAVGQHYLIGDPTGVVSLEGSANGVFRVPTSTCYVHANHPLVDQATRPETDKIEQGSNTHARADRATALGQQAVTQEDLQRILEDREAPISRERESGFMTFGGLSIGLTSPPTMRVTAGPPHETAWTEVSWSV